MPQTDVKSSSRRVPFQATPPVSFGLEPNTKAIGTAGQSGEWKDGCVRPCSNISRTLPRKSLFRRRLKPREMTHCVSRVVEGRFIFQTSGHGSAEAERFVQLMRCLEAFSGIRVLTYVLMSNHFYLLCEVPEPKTLSLLISRSTRSGPVFVTTPRITVTA